MGLIIGLFCSIFLQLLSRYYDFFSLYFMPFLLLRLCVEPQAGAARGGDDWRPPERGTGVFREGI